MWLMLNTCFPLASLEFWYMPSRDCPHDHPKIKTLGAESLMSFPGWQHFIRVVTTCWGIKHVASLREDPTLGGSHLVTPALASCAFPLAHFASLGFTATNGGHKYNYMPSLSSSSSNRVVLGAHRHTQDAVTLFYMRYRNS